MNYIQKNKYFYNFLENKNFEFSESKILDLEKKVKINLPTELKEYYLDSGKNKI